MNTYDGIPGLTSILRSIVNLWGGNIFTVLWKTRHLQLGFLRSKMRRETFQRNEGLQIPIAIALSPTMRCNLECVGCYSRFHSRENEVSFETLDSFMDDAAGAGVMFAVVTGGEPFLRPELMDIYRKHRGVFFLVVTNGTLIDESIAGEISELNNILPAISIEGTREETDMRRGEGVYEKVLDCMTLLRRWGVPFGFSAVLTPSSIDFLGSEEFIDDIIERGCVAGFYNEFVPITPEDASSVPRKDQKEKFKKHLGRIRRKRSIVLVHLPDDEYGISGRCAAVGSGSFHVNSEGYVEPCPFAPYALENIKNSSFFDILRSPFLEAIRKHPTALQCGEIGCALANNREVLEEIADEAGARSTAACRGHLL